MTPDLAALVKRLRNESEHHIGRNAHGNSLSVQALLLEAAAAIESLAAENAAKDEAGKALYTAAEQSIARAERAEQRVKDLEAQLANRS